MSGRERYCWTRIDQHGVVWFLHRMGLSPRESQIARIHYRADAAPGARWRAEVSFKAHQTWGLLGSTKAARLWVERFLSSKCWEWDDCEISEKQPELVT